MCVVLRLEQRRNVSTDLPLVMMCLATCLHIGLRVYISTCRHTHEPMYRTMSHVSMYS